MRSSPWVVSHLSAATPSRASASCPVAGVSTIWCGSTPIGDAYSHKHGLRSSRRHTPVKTVQGLQVHKLAKLVCH
jgi:hypothetical protein